MKYTLAEIAAICQGRLTDPAAGGRIVRSVSTDSRNHGEGPERLFVAIRGRNHDAHDYIGELYARSVRAFIIERDLATEEYSGAGFIRVGSSVAALQALAADYRSGFAGKVVGITGSNGKTVTKERIADLLPPGVKLFRSPKSYNSQTGVPLSVLMIAGDEQVAVIEAGISQKGEMERLEAIIRPDIGIMTNIGDAHQENFATIEEKIREKIELFRGAESIIYNGNYPGIAGMLKKEYPAAQLIDSSRQAGVYARFADRASQENAAAAVTLCDLLGYDHRDTMGRLEGLSPVAMRLELKEGRDNSLIVNDSYNSDINSLAIALDYLSSVAGGRRQTLILSDIFQSGYLEQELYRKVAGLVGNSQVDRMIGIGEGISRHAALFGAGARFYPGVDACLASMEREQTADRAVLVKGSRHFQFERLSHALERKSHTTTLEVDLDAMVNNLNVHRAMLAPSTRIMAMMKAEGYGHGTYEVASMLRHQGVDYLAVAFADEGVELRESGITMPIVVLNADSDSFGLMVAHNLEPEVYNLLSLRDFVATVKLYGEREYPVHIKLDTGMHRLGFTEGELPALTEELLKNRGNIRVASIFSHMPASDERAQDDFSRSQIALFGRLCDTLSGSLGYKPLRHLANSAAIERLPEAQFDMVRLGIGLYGVGAVGNIGLCSVATLRSRIVQIKEHAPGERIGYGREGVITAPARVATIPIGYADGLDRRLGNGRWAMLVGGKPAPTVGRICMDTTMIDITGIDAAEGGEVVIYGSTPGNRVEDMAAVLGTIAYEVMTSISSRVKRIFLKR